MGGVQRKRGNTAGNKKHNRMTKTKHYRRDDDQKFDDLKTPQKRLEEVKDQEKPGGGELYCIPCDRHFATQEAKDSHQKTKGHRRRLKGLEQEPYRG